MRPMIKSLMSAAAVCALIAGASLVNAQPQPNQSNPTQGQAGQANGQDAGQSNQGGQPNQGATQGQTNQPNQGGQPNQGAQGQAIQPNQGARGGIPGPNRGAPNMSDRTAHGSIMMLCASTPTVSRVDEPAPAPQAVRPDLPRWHVHCGDGDNAPAPAPTPPATPPATPAPTAAPRP